MRVVVKTSEESSAKMDQNTDLRFANNFLAYRGLGLHGAPLPPLSGSRSWLEKRACSGFRNSVLTQAGNSA